MLKDKYKESKNNNNNKKKESKITQDEDAYLCKC